MGKYNYINDPVHAIVVAFQTSYGWGCVCHPRSGGAYRDATTYISMGDYNGEKRFSFESKILEGKEKDWDYIRITREDIKKAVELCLKNDIPIYYCRTNGGAWAGLTGVKNDNDETRYRVYSMDSYDVRNLF